MEGVPHYGGTQSQYCHIGIYSIYIQQVYYVRTSYLLSVHANTTAAVHHMQLLLIVVAWCVKLWPSCLVARGALAFTA